MSPFARHPDLDALVAFASGELPPDERERAAAHLRDCARCQDALRFARRLAREAAALPAPSAPPHVLARALASRADGERRILPADAPPASPPASSRRRMAARWAAAAAVLVVAAVALLARTPELAAVAESELRLSPERPRTGGAVSVHYQPAPGLFDGADSLVLRARLRTARHGMYNGGVPVQAIAVLRRGADGRFDGDFTLPDSIVFASLAVEDPAASRIDDHGGRLWELVTHAADGRPSLDALEQRVNDMMGRSWEEGYATARRIAELYPESVRGWSLQQFFERTLLDSAAADSAFATYEARIARAIETAKAEPALGESDIGTFFFRARSRARRGGAADSAEFAYWWARIRREYPRHPQIAQHLALEVAGTHWERPRALLDSLERLYPQLVPIHGPGGNLYEMALQAATRLGDPHAIRRWRERALQGTPDSTRRLMLVLATHAPFRAEAMQGLRALLAGPPAAFAPPRGLTTSAERHAWQTEDARRRLLAALGRALVAEGRTRAGLDTLTLAATGTWDFALFRDVAAAYLAAGDSAAALTMHARIAVDPQTSVAVADSLAATGRARLGEASWDSATTRARREMHDRLLARATPRALRGHARLAADGVVRPLGELTGGRPAVVIFWSRHCGSALEAAPQIAAVAERLRRQGTPVLVVVDEGPSEELARALAERGLTLPVVHDVNGATTAAFSSFGTPEYYVLDGAGRIRFDRVDAVPQLLAQVAALEAE